MDKQIKYLLGVLILLLIASYFLSLMAGLPQFFKDDIIAFLEARFSGEISFSSVSFWPLNRLRLKSFSFVDKKGNQVKIEQLNLDYKLNLKNLAQIIEIRYIEAQKAEILIAEEFAVNSINHKNNKNLDLELSDFKLPNFMQGIKINVLDSKLILQNTDYDLKFDNLNLGLNAEDGRNYQLNLSASFLTNNLVYNNLDLSNLKGEKVELQLQQQDEKAELYFNTSSMAAADFIKLLPQKKYNYQNLNIDLNRLQAKFKSRGKINFKNSKINNYQVEVNFEDLNFKAGYQPSNQQEELNFDFENLNLIISGPKLKIFVPQTDFKLGQNELQVAFDLDQQLNYQLHLNSNDFNYDYSFFEPEITKGEFDFAFDLKGSSNKINFAQVEIAGKDISSKYAELEQLNFKADFLENQIFLKNAELELADASKLNLEASYDLEQKNYLVSAQAEQLQVSEKIISVLAEYNLADDYLNQIRKLEKERFNFNVDAAGYYNDSQDFSAAGDFNFDFSLVKETNNFEIKSEFWYVNNRLFLNYFKLFSDFAYFDLLGEIDFAQKEYKLRYAARDFEPAMLSQSLNFNFDFLNTINPTVKYAEGKISDSFANPTATIDLQLDELAYQNYAFNNLKLKAIYQDDILQLTELRAFLKQAEFSLKGEIRELSTNAVLDLELKSNNFYFQDLAQNPKTDFPLSGKVDLNAELKGALSDYKLDLEFKTANAAVDWQGREFELSNLSSQIKKEDDDFEIIDLSFSHQNLSFKAAGFYNLDSGFDLKYQLNNLEVQNYLTAYPQFEDKAAGQLNFNGKLQGQPQNLVLNFELVAQNLSYDGFELDIQENQFKFEAAQEKLQLKDFNFTFASGAYQLDGQIFDLTGIPKSKINLKLIKVPTAEFFEKYLAIYPFAENIILEGESQLKTEAAEYQITVDLNGKLAQNETNVFSLKGNIARNWNLDFEASKLPLKFEAEQYNFNLAAEADLEFQGSLNGGLKTPILNLSHNLSALKINDTKLKSITGNILVEHQRRFSASEQINFLQGGNLTVDGSYSFNDDDLNLSSQLKSLPISFILSFFGDQVKGDGQLNGDLRAEGSLQNPDLSGKIDLAGNSLKLGIWAPIKNYRGQIKLQAGQALVKELKGDFVDGSFQLGGQLNLLDRAKFWDLNLDAEELYFDYGSLTGDFDTKLKFKGPLLNPSLAGQLELYDFTIGIPFKWPAAGSNQQQEDKDDSFMPRINLELTPTRNVRVKNPNMNVLVEQGDLGLNYNHNRENSLMLSGRLRSNQGRFNYYNSRFTLNTADAIFTPVDEDDIPNLQVNATTYAGGREINVNLNGPANSMRTTFAANPEMSQEEILNLLSSRGALGSAIVGGENIGVQQIITQELIRIAYGFLQEDIISDLESDVKTSLSLDRIEINALQYGLEREFAVYLGKNLNDRFYLEYAAFFRDDEARQDEISFQYKFTDITTLKGTYFGDQEYEITLENTIEF